jgi:hypothetical protein
VCKKGDVPTNYVAVEEFNSPQCDDGGNPFAKNALRAEPVKDGITVCGLPRYEVIGARVAELLPCEAVESDRCNARLDGLPNAIVLRSPAECIKQKLPADLKINCSASAGLTEGAYGYMVAQLTSPNCPPPRAPNHDGHMSSANAWLARMLPARNFEPNWLAVCADDFNIGFGVVVRRFKNVNCPANKYVEGGREGLTGWIILLNPRPGTITVCAVYTSISYKSLGPPYNTLYHAATKYSELCGGPQNRVNSFEMTVSSNGKWVVSH